MPEDSERAVYVQYIDPKRTDEYVRAHDDVPDAVAETMRAGGATSFELYVRDDVAVCILEARDLEEYREAVTGDPAIEEWERHVAQFKREGVDVDAPEGEQIPFMECIWSLER